MRVRISVSTESGSALTSLAPLDAATSSRTKSGFPPARSTRTASTSSDTAISPAAASASACAARASIGPKRELYVPVDGRVGEVASLGTPRHAHEPGPRRRLARQRVKQVAGRIVDPVPVLDDEERRHQQDAGEQRPDALVQPVAPELRLELVDLGRRGNLGIEGNGDQRRQRRQVGHHRGDPGHQGSAGLARVHLRGQADERPQQITEHRVRRRRRVLVAAAVELREAERLLPQLLEQAGLADARLADQLHDLLLAHARAVDGESERGQLGLAADERELRLRLLLLLAEHGADAVGRDRAFLSFQQERLRGRLEARPGTFQNVGGGQQAAGLGARGEARREIDRVAHDVVGAAGLGPDVPAERRAAVDSGAQRQPLVGPEDGSERTQHPLLVGASGRGRPADDVDLAAALVDVRPEPGQAQLLELVAEKLRKRRQVAVDRLGAVGRDLLVDARELEEGGGDLTVLRLAGLEQQVSPQRLGDVQLDLVR